MALGLKTRVVAGTPLPARATRDLRPDLTASRPRSRAGSRKRPLTLLQRAGLLLLLGLLGLLALLASYSAWAGLRLTAFTPTWTHHEPSHPCGSFLNLGSWLGQLDPGA